MTSTPHSSPAAQPTSSLLGRRGPANENVGEVKERHPDLRVVPRTTVENVEAMLEAGAEGAVVTFPDEASMRELARRYR